MNTIAQLMAVITADTTGLNTAASDSEKVLKGLQASAERSAAAVEDYFTKGAAKAKASVADQQQFMYRSGQLSVDQYRNFLRQQMSAYDEYSAEWMTAANRLVAVDRNMAQQHMNLAKQVAAYQTAQARETSQAQAEEARRVTAVEQEQYNVRKALARRQAETYLQSQQQVADANERTRAGFMSIGSGLLNLAAIFTLVGGGAAKMASDFDSMTQKIAANTNMSKGDLADMRSTILKMGSESGSDFADLGQGYKHAYNYGFRGKDATTVVTAANMAAVGTGASVDETTKMLAQQLHEYQMKSSMALPVMNALHNIAAGSDLDLGEFVRNAGQAMGQAANLRMKNGMIESGAAVAALVRRGGFDPAEADTQVLGMENKIANPTPAEKRELGAIASMTGHKELIKDFSQEGLEAKGLSGVLKDLTAALGAHNSEVTHLIGAYRGGRGAFSLTSAAAKDFFDLIKAGNAGLSGQTTAVQSIYKGQLEQPEQQFKRLTQTIKAEFIPVGNEVMQDFIRMGPAILAVAHAVESMMHAFAGLPKPIQEVVIGLGAMRILDVIVKSLLGVNSIIGPLIGLFGKMRTGVLALAGGEGIAGLTASLTTFGETLSGLALAGGPILLVAGAIGVLIYNIVKLKQDQDNANKSMQDFANMQNRVAAAGPAGASIVESQKIAQTIAGRQTALAHYRSDYITRGSEPGLRGNALAREEDLRQIALIPKQIAQLQHDYNLQVAARATMGRSTLTGDTFGGSQATTVSEGQKLGSMFGFRDIGGRASSGHIKESDHYTGSALDFMTHGDASKGQSLANYAAQHAIEEHIKYIIWQQHIYNPSRANEGWRPMKDRGSPTANHMDHVHISFNPDGSNSSTPNASGSASTSGAVGGAHRNPVNLDSVTAYLKRQSDAQKELHKEEREAAAKKKKEHEEAIAAVKKLQDAYKSQYGDMQKQIDLYGVDTNAARVMYELHKGELVGIHGLQAQRLIDEARVLDSMKAQTEAHKALQTLSMDTRLLGHEALKSAISSVGGQSEWEKLGNGTSPLQKKLVGASATGSVLSRLYSLNMDYQDKVAQALHPVKTASDEANRAIDDLLKKTGAASDDPRIKKYIESIRAAAGTVDKDAAVKWYGSETHSQKDALDKLKGGILGPHAQDDAAVQDYLDKNKDEIAKLRAAKPDAQNYINNLTNGVRNQLNEQRTIEGQKQMLSILQDVTRQALDLKANDPYDKWLNSLKAWNAEANGGRGGFVLPQGMNEPTLRKLYDAKEQADAMTRVNDTMTTLKQQAYDLRNLDPFKEWMKTYQVWDDRMNHGKGGYRTPVGVNEGSLHQTFDYQSKIQLAMQAAQGIEGVLTGAFTNAYQHGFRGFFKNVIQGFNQMLVQMAAQYLQSQLLKVLQRGLGGAIAGSGPSSGGSTTSVLAWLGGSLLGLFGGGGGGASTPGATNPLPGGLSMSSGTFYAAAGGTVPGANVLVGDDGPEVVHLPAGSRVYPNGSMPGGRASGATVNHYDLHVHSPDLPSFQRSAGNVLDEMHNAAARAAARNH